MRVLFVIDTIDSSRAGTQRQLLETIPRLNAEGIQTQLVCLWASQWMSENRLPCPYTALDYRGFLKANFPSVVRSLSRLIREQRPDVIQTFFEDSIFVAWLAAELAGCNSALVSSRRDIGLGPKNQPWYHRLYRVVLPAVNRRFAGIVANSERVRTYAAKVERTPLNRITVLRNGVALADLAIRVPPPEPMATHNDCTWIVCVASLTPVKRHDLALWAFRELVSSRPHSPVRLLFLGEGPLGTQLKELADSHGIGKLVHFHGSTEDVGPYLRNADIGLLCSDKEGLSNAILEYMSFGLPVVATDCGGNPELVLIDSGILVPTDDAKTLSAALGRLVDNPGLRLQMGQNGRRRVESDFDWPRATAALISYYHSIARNCEAGANH